MKRLLIATAAFALMMSACSSEEEPAEDTQTSMEQQKEDNARLIRMWEEAAESETEETEVDNSERHQFEVGESLAEKRKTREEINDVFENYLDESAEKKSELDMAIESASKKHNAASKKADEYAAAYEGRETFVNYHTRMDTVNIDVLNAELYRSGGQSRMSVEFNVENTANEQKKVPLIRSVIVTDGGFQAEGDRQLSVEPEWDLMGATKTSGEIIFDLELEDIDAIESVTLVIPGVDFRSDYEDRIEINFNE